MTSIAVTVAARSSLFEQAHPPSIPITSAQWKSALREIKLLYIQKQYKRCVARSSCILAEAREPMNPIYKIYLHFYSAICYEAMGMYAHEYSNKKVPLLREALGSLAACLCAFPVRIEPGKTIRRDSGVGLCGDIGFGPRVRQKQEADGDRDENNCSNHVLGPQPRAEPQEEVYMPPGSISPFSSSSFDASTTRSRSRSRSISLADSVVTCITDIIDKTLDCRDDDPFLSDLDGEEIVGSEDYNSIYRLDGEDPDPEPEPVLEHLLVPSPLQVRKPKSSTPSPKIPPSLRYCNGVERTLQTQQSHLRAKAEFTSEMHPQPRPLPPFLLPLPLDMGPSLTAAVNRTDEDIRESAYTYYPEYPEQNATFRSLPTSTINYSHECNSNLTFLHTQITKTITHLQTLIQDVMAAQKAHNSSRQSVSGGLQRSTSFWSFSPIQNKEKNMNEPNSSARQLPVFQRRTSLYNSYFMRESIRDRIARLRAQGWETVGLKNPERGWKGADYYRDFCEMVLDELYLG
ncbi:hypothetical protein BDW67DRAFT_181951 [Aspergillus spinulosporus]